MSRKFTLGLVRALPLMSALLIAGCMSATGPAADTRQVSDDDESSPYTDVSGGQSSHPAGLGDESEADID